MNILSDNNDQIKFCPFCGQGVFKVFFDNNKESWRCMVCNKLINVDALTDKNNNYGEGYYWCKDKGCWCKRNKWECDICEEYHWGDCQGCRRTRVKIIDVKSKKLTNYDIEPCNKGKICIHCEQFNNGLCDGCIRRSFCTSSCVECSYNYYHQDMLTDENKNNNKSFQCSSSGYCDVCAWYWECKCRRRKEVV